MRSATPSSLICRTQSAGPSHATSNAKLSQRSVARLIVAGAARHQSVFRSAGRGRVYSRSDFFVASGAPRLHSVAATLARCESLPRKTAFRESARTLSLPFQLLRRSLGSIRLMIWRKMGASSLCSVLMCLLRLLLIKKRAESVHVPVMI